MELLVAVTITALLSTAVIASFRIGISSWQRGSDFLDRSQRLTAAVELIQKQIGSASPLYSLKNVMAASTFPQAVPITPQEGPDFAGEPREMVFVTDYPVSPLSEGGLLLVHYTVDWPEESVPSVSSTLAGTRNPNASGQGMVLRMTASPIVRREDFLNLVEQTRRPQAGSVTLLVGIQDIQFQYWDEEEPPQNAGAPGEKVIPRIVPFNQWDGIQRNRLPLAISIQIRFLANDKRTGAAHPYNRDAVDLFIPINVMKSL